MTIIQTLNHYKLELPASTAYGQAAAVGPVHFYIGEIYAATSKIVKSNDNVLSCARV